MPPRLVDGKPVAQRHLNLPSVSEWCNCSDCITFKYFDASTNTISNGRYITARQKKEHNMEEKRKEIALQHMHSIAKPPLDQSQGPQKTSGYGSEESPRAFVKTSSQGSPKESKSLGKGEPTQEGNSEIIVPSEFVSPLTARRHSGSSGNPSSSPRFSSVSTNLNNIKQSLTILTSDVFLRDLQARPLVFKMNPSQHISSEEFELVEYELDLLHPSNQEFLNLEVSLYDSERYLRQQEKHLAGSPGHYPRVQKLLEGVLQKQEYMAQLRERLWKQQHEIFETEQRRMVDTERYINFSLCAMEPVSCLAYMLAATLHLLADLSFNDLGFVLSSLYLLIKMALKGSQNPESVTVLNSIPSDVRTVISSLEVNPLHSSMVCCPSCFQTYKFDRRNPMSYPELCTYRSTARGKMCGRRLHNSVGGLRVPKREYVYQDLHHWIARMYSRPDIEKLLDAAHIKNIGEESVITELEDIWDGSVLRQFKGPDGERHFLDKPERKGRLIFGLNMDGFNPYGNKIAGKKVSVCGVYLVCYNLPPEIRFAQENIFLLGIVPGPNEPSTHEVNNVLRPLVDDLLFLWHTGIYLSKTHRYPLGRPIRCALIPVVCDLPAARRVAGLAGHGATTFCSECLLNINNINDLDQTKWTPREYAKHVTHATEWRDAKSEAEQADTFRAYGARWSELLRLPYWDPTRFVVIDAMHAFYLRMFHRHVREMWGMNVKLEDGDGIPTLKITSEDIQEAEDVLRHGSATEVQGLKRIQLQYLCREIGTHFGGYKGELCRALFEHRITQGWFHANGQAVVMAHSKPRNGSVRMTSAPTATTKNSSELEHPPLSSATSTHDPTVQVTDPSAPRAQTYTADPENHSYLDELYRTSPKTTLTKLDHTVLVSLCVLKLGGSHSQYVMASKKTLTQRLQDQRLADGLVASNGRLISQKKRVQHPDIGIVVTDVAGTPTTNEIDDKTREDLLNLYQMGKKTAFKRLKKSVLTILCALRFRDGRIDATAEFEDLKKQKLLEIVHDSRVADGVITEDGALVEDNFDGENAVLGQATLKAIRDDMESTFLPTWLSRAPKHPGEVQWGKFKAAEWKAFCTVNLPITLTRLWASKPQNSTHYRMLTNFMHLVTAVKIASKRTVTTDDINEYESHMKAYMSGFVRLYPHINVTPYQHLALHFPAHLHRFGPTHSWRCFAFERYNGLIQKLPNNNKFGEMEKSKFLRFCRAQNIRALYNRTLLPPELRPVVEFFDKRYELRIPDTSYSRGIRAREVGSGPSSFKLDSKQIRDFEEWMARRDPAGKNGFIHSNHRILAHVERFGQRFQAGDHANSNILYRNPVGIDAAAQIVALFSYTNTGSPLETSNIKEPDDHNECKGDDKGGDDDIQESNIFAILREYQTLSTEDAQDDPLQHLPSAVGFHVYNNLIDDLVFIHFSDIKSHFVAHTLNVTGRVLPTLHVIPVY